MNGRAELDIGPLSWVKDEITLALSRVAEQLQKYAGQQESASLSDARTHLHQAHGALAIVGLDGITEFSGAIERLLDALADGSVPWSPVIADVAQEGLAALSQYLDELIAGRPDQPLRLLPVYRRLNQARGAQDVVAADLFFPDLTQRPPKREITAPALDEQAHQARLKAARLGFERGLAKWLRQESGQETAGLRDMRNSIAIIEALQNQPATRAFWWVALAYFDVLAGGGVDNDGAARHLCTRIDAQVRKLLDGTQAVAERLMRDVLYEVAVSPVGGEHVDMVRAAYRLHDLGLTVAATDDPREAILRHMREQLAAATEHWEGFCAGTAIALPRFHEQSTQLVTLAQQLGHMDLARLVAGLANAANLLRKNPLLHTDALAAEVATALLLTESAINHFPALDVDFAAQVDAITGRLNALQRGDLPAAFELPELQALAQRAGNRIALHQVVRDLKSQLLLVERGLDSFFRDVANTASLESVSAPLQKIAAMFAQLEQPGAIAVIDDCANSIVAFASPGHQRQPGAFEEVARKISALGFFVEQLQHGPADLDALLKPVAPAEAIAPSVESELSQLARAANAMVGTLMEKDGPAPLDEQTRELLRGELRQNLEGLRDNARLVADESIERQADAALSALDNAAPLERIEAIVAPLAPESTADDLTLAPADSARLAQASADEVDSELLGIFIEEVVQILDTVGVQLFHSLAHPQNSEHVVNLRRCFHTLKGSSRMVGLLDFSEAARAVETTLGSHLQHGGAATPQLHEMVDAAQHIVSDWIERLQRHASAPDTAPLLRLCEALKATSTAAVDAADPVPIVPPVATVAIGSMQVSRNLFNTYLHEAQEHLATLQQQWQRSPTPLMIRASHTLASTSATLGLVPLQVLAQALELVLERFAHAAAAIDDATEQTLQQAVQRLASMVASVAEQQFPQAAEDLAARLQAINVAPPTAALPIPSAAERTENDLLPLFLEECHDLIPAVASGFRSWRTDAADVAGAESLQRLLHTLKGSARMAGLTEIGAAIHGVETRLADAQAKADVSSLLIDQLETEFDRVIDLIDSLQSPVGADGDAQRPMLRVRAELVDMMVSESGEIAIARSRIEGGTKALRSSLTDLTENVSRLRSQLRELEIQADSSIQSQLQAMGAQSRDQDFDPLEMDRYTRLQELTRILAEGVNDVATVEHNLMRELDQVDAALSQQARLSRALTQRLMGVRMVPFASIAERLQRVVRQTADEVGKKVAFTIDGGDTELDRSVLERMTGPIEHLLRNAVVHGIEAGNLRADAAKPEVGAVNLSLVQSGNEVEISVSDDGRGLDYERIHKEASRRGLIAADQQVDQSQLAQFIFQPGFTTASTLSAVAGRGVGMDVVRAETTALGGHIEVRSQTPSGTRFALHLPLTLAVIPALLVKSGSRRYALPSAMVVQANEMKPDAMMQLRSAATVEWRGQHYALHYLPRLLGDAAALPAPQRRHWVILLRGGVHCVALEVDALVGNEEVVIKNIGPQLARVPGITGATVLGDGEVVLIINPVALAARNAEPMATSLALKAKPDNERSAQGAAGTATVMVVDDSLTVRKISGRLLERAGYRVITAKDGVDALEQLAEALPVVVLADIEMPRMDGFELLRRIRADSRLQSLPVIMITSRIADKHRNYATELGANHYLGKPYDEQSLLALIAGYAAK